MPAATCIPIAGSHQMSIQRSKHEIKTKENRAGAGSSEKRGELEERHKSSAFQKEAAGRLAEGEGREILTTFLLTVQLGEWAGTRKTDGSCRYGLSPFWALSEVRCPIFSRQSMSTFLSPTANFDPYSPSARPNSGHIRFPNVAIRGQATKTVRRWPLFIILNSPQSYSLKKYEKLALMKACPSNAIQKIPAPSEIAIRTPKVLHKNRLRFLC